ncbi:MAG: helix-turn-helix transcriptional regulator [Deltaproteobacteria bacterium]|nr:helix-turn-helix transcriptional regulator [Deltaproteobacteria bacterium]
MRPAPDKDAFVSAPLGRWIAGETFLYFCASPTLYGFTLWGWPTEADMRRLAHFLTVELLPGAVPHVSLVDTRRIRRADPGAFAALDEYVRRHHDALQRMVTRLALVRPAGMEGAVVAGFYQVLQPPYPHRVFEDAVAALEWLEAPRAATLAEELDGLHAAVTGVAPAVGALQAALGGHLDDATPATLARLLGLSQRTLQRRLQEAGTTFQAELNAARIREAQRRMLATRDPLTAIALDVGCASLQHFSALFRRLVRASPSEWRRANAR